MSSCDQDGVYLSLAGVNNGVGVGGGGGNSVMAMVIIASSNGPTLFTQIERDSVKASAVANLCDFKGNPAASYIWSFNGPVRASQSGSEGDNINK